MSVNVGLESTNFDLDRICPTPGQLWPLLTASPDALLDLPRPLGWPLGLGFRQHLTAGHILTMFLALFGPGARQKVGESTNVAQCPGSQCKT